MNSTRFQKSIKDPQSNLKVLKKGSYNKKLGFNVTTKKWEGKKLYSLTLVERETCPKSCHHWEDCFGNNMPFAHRFSTVGLQDKLEKEIEELTKKHKKGIVIRLHVLGDFYSVDYVNFWEKMLVLFPTLSVYGYTARKEDKIGKAIQLLNIRFSERWVIRHSGNQEYKELKIPKDNWRFAANESFEGPSFNCPEQTNKVEDCASCGLCWIVPKTVRFATH